MDKIEQERLANAEFDWVFLNCSGLTLSLTAFQSSLQLFLDLSYNARETYLLMLLTKL